MASATRSFRAVLAAYASSMLAVGALAALLAVATASAPALGEFLAAGWIVIGLGWIVLGFALAPSVSTFLGPGPTSFRGGAPPVIWPSSALPEANPPVVADLAEKLSQGTDAGILVAALGLALFSAGVVAYVNEWFGVLAAVLVLIAVAVLWHRR